MPVGAALGLVLVGVMPVTASLTACPTPIGVNLGLMTGSDIRSSPIRLRTATESAVVHISVARHSALPFGFRLAGYQSSKTRIEPDNASYKSGDLPTAAAALRSPVVSSKSGV
jgi:hypothetical protein